MRVVDEKGISSVIGFIMIASATMIAISVYIVQQMPYDWKEDEYNAMLEVKNAFLKLREVIPRLDPGDVATVSIPLGALSPHPAVAGSSGGEIEIKTARSLTDVTGFETNANAFSWWRAVDTYVKEASPTFNYQSPDYENEYLYVSSTQGNRIWTFLKFDLADSALYDSYDYEFRDDVVIHQAQLMLYIIDADLTETPTDKLQVLVPQQVEVWGLENDAWWENITWNDAQNIHDPTRDVKIENITIDSDGEWAVWDVTDFVREKFEPLLGWGKWYQTKWYTSTGTAEVGRFSSGYYKYRSKDSTVNDGSSLTGSGTLTSSVFDAGEIVYWNYAHFSCDGDPSVTVYFDNDPDPITGGISFTLSAGSSSGNPNIYARYAQYQVSLGGAGDEVYSVTVEYTAHLSFLLREPWKDGQSHTTTLQTLACFNSGDNSRAEAYGFEPKLRIVYSRTSRVGYAKQGLLEFGYVKLKGNTEYFPETNYCYEGGAVFVERGTGWYQTLIAYPPDLVTLVPTEEKIVEPDGSVKRVAILSVTRYQIMESSIEGESVEASGATALRASPQSIEWLVEPPDEPNTDEVTITIITEHPSIWRDVMEQIAAEVNYVLSGYESYYTYEDYTSYDYSTISLTIRGDPGEGGTKWTFKYSEKVVWLKVSAGTYLGGRT